MFYSISVISASSIPHLYFLPLHVPPPFHSSLLSFLRRPLHAPPPSVLTYSPSPPPPSPYSIMLSQHSAEKLESVFFSGHFLQTPLPLFPSPLQRDEGPPLLLCFLSLPSSLFLLPSTTVFRLFCFLFLSFVPFPSLCILFFIGSPRFLFGRCYLLVTTSPFVYSVEPSPPP